MRFLSQIEARVVFGHVKGFRDIYTDVCVQTVAKVHPIEFFFFFEVARLALESSFASRMHTTVDWQRAKNGWF